MVKDQNELEEEVKSVIMAESSDLVESGGDDDVMLPPANSNWNHLPPRMTESENLPPTEKPLVSSRFGHRKSVKASSEGGRAVLRVTRPKRIETPAMSVRKHMMRNQVRNLLNVLSPKERKIIKLRFKTNGVKKKVRKKKKKKKKKLYMKNVQAQQLLHEGPVFVEKDEGGRRSRVQTPAHGSGYKFSKCPKEKRKKKIRYEYPEDEESNNDKSRRAREKIRKLIGVVEVKTQLD